MSDMRKCTNVSSEMEKPIDRERVALTKRDQMLILDHWDYALRLAFHFLRKWGVRIVRDEIESLVGLALCEAAKNFDRRRGVSFRTFLYYHLFGTLTHAIAGAKRELSLGREVVAQAHSGISGVEFGPGVASSIDCPEQMFAMREFASRYRSLSDQLSELEQVVVQRHVLEDQTINRIARDLGYSRSYLSRVKTKALLRLRRSFHRVDVELPLAA